MKSCCDHIICFFDAILVQSEKWRASKNNTYQHSRHCLAVSVSRFKKPRRAIKSSSTAKSAIEVNPRIQGPAFSNLLHKYDPGELPSARTIRRILFEMRQDQSLYDEDEHADVDYQAIPSACQTFCEKNPGSVAVCETNDAVMAEIFAAADPDQEGTASRSALCSTVTGDPWESTPVRFKSCPGNPDPGLQKAPSAAHTNFPPLVGYRARQIGCGLYHTQGETRGWILPDTPQDLRTENDAESTEFGSKVFHEHVLANCLCTLVSMERHFIKHLLDILFVVTVFCQHRAQCRPTGGALLIGICGSKNLSHHSIICLAHCH